MDILYGKNPVLEALRSGRGVRKVVVAESAEPEPRLQEILALAAERTIPVETARRQRLNNIAHTEHHQGVVGYFHSRAPETIDDVLRNARHPALLLALDGIQDPQNLGALARTADAVGADGLITPRHRAASMTPAAVKAAAGATEHLHHAVVPNLVAALDAARDAGMWRVGLDAGASMRYDAFDFTVPVVVVVGSEGEGLRALTKRHCDALVSIPMSGGVASLNAGVAGAIIMYEIARQRGFTTA